MNAVASYESSKTRFGMEGRARMQGGGQGMEGRWRGGARRLKKGKERRRECVLQGERRRSIENLEGWGAGAARGRNIIE